MKELFYPPKRPPTHKPYTGIGSRDVPEDMAVLQIAMGKVLCDLGWHGMSGLADGSDKRYYLGAQQSSRFDQIGFTNIIPYSGFKSSKESTERHYHDPENGIFALDHLPHKNRAYWLGIGARGGTFGLKGELSSRDFPAGVALHTRNAMQVLDLDLCTRSRFVHCWAPPRGRKGHVTGGTATAVALAMHLGIDVVNLATRAGLTRTLDFLELHKFDLDYTYYRGLVDTLKF